MMIAVLRCRQTAPNDSLIRDLEYIQAEVRVT